MISSRSVLTVAGMSGNFADDVRRELHAVADAIEVSDDGLERS
jgi:hypothetical protein